MPDNVSSKSTRLIACMLFWSIVPPSLVIKPSDETVIENEEIRFHCSATGNPVPRITWIKDGKTVGSGETLSLESKRNDSGKYWCSADNGLSEAVNASAYLDVQCEYDNTEWTNERKKEWTNVRMNERTNEWTNVQMLKWTKERMNE